MNDEAVFLAAIESTPNDDTLRLVYADWLDEHGRPGAEFIRLDCEFAKLERQREQDELLRHQLREMQADVELVPDDWYERSIRVAGLLVASRKLDLAWLRRVCRVPEDELFARDREIMGWLRRKVTVTQALARMHEWDRPTPTRSLWGRLRSLFKPSATETTEDEGPSVRHMRKWIEENMLQGDELWEYDTGRDSWRHLCGEMGYAIVRDGRLVEFDMLMMN